MSRLRDVYEQEYLSSHNIDMCFEDWLIIELAKARAAKSEVVPDTRQHQQRKDEIVRCPMCGQIDNGQTGEYPCMECGLPVLHDERPTSSIA
jgi:hypothetical protein